MLNHTYTSVKNANLVDCGKKQHIPSQPFPLLKENFLGEFRTELERKKVLANLGIATELSLEWGNIKGDIGSSKALTDELDARTTYLSRISGFTQTVIEGIQYLETVVGGEEEGEEEQNNRLLALEKAKDGLIKSLDDLSKYIENTVDFNITELQTNLNIVSTKVDNITELIKVSAKPGNALELITEEVATHIWDQTLNDNEGDYREATQDENATHIFDQSINSGEGGYREVISTAFTGLYVPDLSAKVSTATNDITQLQGQVKGINNKLDEFVTREELGGGDFKFVTEGDFDTYTTQTSTTLENIQNELKDTVKTGKDGHVATLYVNQISKENTEESIKITDSFDVQSGIPLDVRFVRENLEELYKLPVAVCYPGMGVIVNALSSLYILRRPAEEVAFNQEYIADPNNWKCPEDLVTVAMSRQEYEDLKDEEINPNVFYYIYEDEITRTQEPKREEYENDEQFQKEWQKWVDSLKTLSQEYMSAVWGVDIENKLGKKASSQSVTLLKKEIENIKGNGNNPSLESLNKSIQKLQTKDEDFKVRVDEILIKAGEVEQGRLVNVENEVSKVKDSLSDYITKDYIQDESNDFIFVKDSEYQQDQEDLKTALATKVETKEIVTDAFKLQEKILQIKDDKLQLEDEVIASVDDIPVLEIIPQTEYDRRSEAGEIENHIYYYTYDGDVRLVTSEDLAKESNKLQKQLNVLFQGGTAEDIENTLGTIFLPIETWNKFYQEYQLLSELVKSLEQRMIQIEVSNVMHTGSSIYVSSNPDRCYYEDNTVYIESDLLTFE